MADVKMTEIYITHGNPRSELEARKSPHTIESKIGITFVVGSLHATRRKQSIQERTCYITEYSHYN